MQQQARLETLHEGEKTFETDKELSGEAAADALQVADNVGPDLLLMGGKRHFPVLEAILGITVVKVLRQTRTPGLVCR